MSGSGFNDPGSETRLLIQKSASVYYANILTEKTNGSPGPKDFFLCAQNMQKRARDNKQSMLDPIRISQGTVIDDNGN